MAGYLQRAPPAVLNLTPSHLWSRIITSDTKPLEAMLSIFYVIRVETVTVLLAFTMHLRSLSLLTCWSNKSDEVIQNLSCFGTPLEDPEAPLGLRSLSAQISNVRHLVGLDTRIRRTTTRFGFTDGTSGYAFQQRLGTLMRCISQLMCPKK